VHYGRGPLEGWFKAALAAAVPDAAAERDPAAVAACLRLYVFAMLEARAAHPQRTHAWHATLAHLGAAFVRLKAAADASDWAALGTTLVDVTRSSPDMETDDLHAAVQHAMGMGAVAEARGMRDGLLVCYARALAEQPPLVGHCPYETWADWLDGLRVDRHDGGSGSSRSSSSRSTNNSDSDSGNDTT